MVWTRKYRFGELARAARKSFSAESATNIIARHDPAGVNLMEDEALSPVDFLVPRHFQERALRIRASRLPAGADALGTEVDIFSLRSPIMLTGRFVACLGG